MMSNDDAELLLDENFIAIDNNHPFDSVDNENDPYFVESSKYKKKNDFKFNSLWRKPKIGRRKTRSIGKNQGNYERNSNFNPTNLKTRGKYVKDRESFETIASIPLSDFDEAKDTLPFLHFRSDISHTEGEGKSINSKQRISLKGRTALNPKMILTQASAKRMDNKSKSRKDEIVGGKQDEDEPRDIFKPILNTNKKYDGIQMLSKESPKKVKSEDDVQKKQNEDELEDQRDKENFFQDSVYCGNLYQDHGPILSSLSEDTINSDSVRGEQFLDDHLIESMNEIDCSNNDIDGPKEENWGFRDVNKQNEMLRIETGSSVHQSASIETSVRSFSDRLKLFQTKTTEPAQQSKFGTIKQEYSFPIGNHQKEERNKNLETAMIPAIVEPKISSPAIENRENFTKNKISTLNEQEINEAQSDSQRISSGTTNSRSFDKVSSTNGRVLLKQRSNSEVSTGIGRNENEVEGKGVDRDEFVSQSEPNCVRKEQDISLRSLRTIHSHSIVQRSSLNSLEARRDVGRKIFDRGDSIANDRESELNSKTDEGTKAEISGEIAQAPTSINSDEMKNKICEISDQTQTELKSTKATIQKNHRESYMAAASRFGRSIKRNENQFGKKTSVNKSENFKGEKDEEEKSVDIKLQQSKKDDSLVDSSLFSDEEPTTNLNESKHGICEETDQAKTRATTYNAKTEKNHHRKSFRAAASRFGRSIKRNENQFGKITGSNVGGSRNERDEEQKDDEERSSKQSNHVVAVVQLSQEEPVQKTESDTYGTNLSSESRVSDVSVDNRTISSLDSSRRCPSKSTVTNFKNQSSNLRKSSIEKLPKKKSCTRKELSLETHLSTNNSLDVNTSESMNEKNSEYKAQDKSTVNTTMTSTSCDKMPRTSFAQQSASIFGVTLSKTRRNEIKKSSETKESDIQIEKPVAASGCAQKPLIQNIENDSRDTTTQSDVLEKEINENSLNEKQSCIDIKCGRGKFSLSSTSVYRDVQNTKNEISQPEQKEKQTTRKHSLSSPLAEINENKGAESLDDEMLSNSSNSNFRPRKLKPLSISARRKLFEQATVRNQKRSSGDFENTECGNSPRCNQASLSPLNDPSLSNKRGSSENMVVFENKDLQIQQEKPESHSVPVDENHGDDDCNDDGDDDGDGEDIIFNRRKTLKSTHRRSRGTSALLQPKQKPYDAVFCGSGKSDDMSMNDPQDCSSKVNIDSNENDPKTKNISCNSENSLKANSPRRNAYSLRRKFFENLDRKRVQSSMSRPLAKHSTNSHKEHEVESCKVETPRDINGLPMFVTVEEDFMLQDNISTCLSASENRSVVCKPDALLYSVSQKAIALMSAKAEINATRSFSNVRQAENKESFRSGSNEKQQLTQRYKMNRHQSSKNTTTTTHSQLHSRFARKKAIEGLEGNYIAGTEDKGSLDTESPISRNQQVNRFKASNFSQRYNRCVGGESASAMRRESKNDQEEDDTIESQEEELMKRRTSFTNERTHYHRSYHNRSYKKKSESEISQPSGSQEYPKKDPIMNNSKFQLEVGTSPPLLQSIGKVSQDNDYIGTDDCIESPSDKVRCTNENSKATQQDEEDIMVKQSINNHDEGKSAMEQTESMSIRARRAFFESHCGKVDQLRRKKAKEEESTVANGH